MKLHEINHILSTVDMLHVFLDKTTGHEIANNINAWSRSTTYRKLKKLRKMGLLSRMEATTKNGKQSHVWFITELGHAFLESYQPLPF